MRLIGFAIYLGIGAILHALFNGAQFDWTSAWTFGWLLGWPIMLFITFFAVVAAAFIGFIVFWLIWEWFDMMAKWREKRRKARAA